MGFFENLFSGNTKKQVLSGTAQTGGLKLFGDEQYSVNNTDSRDMSKTFTDARTYNINSSGASGSVITTKKQATTTLTPSQSLEKPINFTPALVSGGTTTATGGGEAKSGLPLVPIIAVGGILVLGALFIPKPKARKK